MHTWGRIFDAYGKATWVKVVPADNGDLTQIYLTTLIQNLQLSYGESPFHGTAGLPAVQSVLTQIAPDFYVAQTQARFAQYFASLIITRVQIQQTIAGQTPPPTYRINAVAKTGAVLPEKTIPTRIPV